MSNDPHRFSGQTVIVTGAGAGIGRATVERLLSDGARVIAVDALEERLAHLPAATDDRIVAVAADIVFHADAVEFRTAWLVCSVLTEVGVLFVLRTHGPFYRSRPGRALVVSSIVIVGITLALPSSALGPPLQLIPLPPPLILIVIVTVLAYLATTEAAKGAFWVLRDRRAPRTPTRRDLRPPPSDAVRSILGA